MNVLSFQGGEVFRDVDCIDVYRIQVPVLKMEFVRPMTHSRLIEDLLETLKLSYR